MALSDPIGDLLTRIRNAQRTGDATVVTPSSRLRSAVLDVLRKEGYIRGYSQAEHGGGARELTIELKYYEGEPVIREITRVSTPGRRVYSGIKTLQPVQGGLGIAILSTPKGVLSDADAREANVGGEVLCRVF